MYQQVYDPMGNVVFSTLVAAIPILVLMYFIAFAPAPRFLLVWDMPSLHNLVQRMPPVAPPDARPEAARFVINWLSTAGTGVFVAALLSRLALRLSAAQWREAFGQTLRRMKTPVLVIGLVLGLGFLTRYAGTDAVLGLAFTGVGFLYPFFASYLGALGAFLTGSDTASNAVFRIMQCSASGECNLIYLTKQPIIQCNQSHVISVIVADVVNIY